MTRYRHTPEALADRVSLGDRLTGQRTCGEIIANMERLTIQQEAERAAFAPILAQRDAAERIRMEAIWARDEMENRHANQ